MELTGSKRGVVSFLVKEQIGLLRIDTLVHSHETMDIDLVA